jgi:aryl-alcohol dehydrogenase-like predicted oxidoreductase
MDKPTGFSRAVFLKGAAGAALSLATVPLIVPAFAAVPAMNERPVRKSANSLKLPVIGLGTRSMSKSDAKAVAGQGEVIATLLDGGGKVIDTAANYTGGDSEEVIGAALAAKGRRKDAFLVTKFGERGKDAGVRSMENSFKSLQADVIDLMFVHNMIDVPTQVPNIKEYKAKGKIRYVGVSDTGRNQDELIKYLDDLDFVEFAYAADSREAEARLLPACLDKGVSVLVALPLGRGRALGAVKGKEVPEWARKELGVETFAQLLLKFVIGHPAVTVAIPSTLNPHHMAENLAAGRGPLPDEKQRAKIAEIWA